MKPNNYVAVVLGFAAAMTGVALHADNHGKEAHGNHRIDRGMQAISNAATIGQPGYGWRYFADERKGSAVAISPGGDYFHSHGRDHGQGPTLVFKATGSP